MTELKEECFQLDLRRIKESAATAYRSITNTLVLQWVLHALSSFYAHQLLQLIHYCIVEYIVWKHQCSGLWFENILWHCIVHCNCIFKRVESNPFSNFHYITKFVDINYTENTVQYKTQVLFCFFGSIQDTDELEYAVLATSIKWTPTCITSITPGTVTPVKKSCYQFKCNYFWSRLKVENILVKKTQKDTNTFILNL